MAINIKKGDEVIVLNQTHVSTVHAFQILGAKPVFVDSNISDGNIDTKLIKKKKKKKLKQS